MNPNPGWYLKSVNDNVAHWWDGQNFTGQTTPRTSYPFDVFPVSHPAVAVTLTPPPYNPLSAPPPVVVPVAPVQYGAQVNDASQNYPIPSPQQFIADNPQYGQPSVAPNKTKGILIAIGCGVVALLAAIIIIVVVVVNNGSNNSNPDPITAPTTEPVDPAPTTEPAPIPTDEPAPADGVGQAGAVTEAAYAEALKANIGSLANSDPDKLITAGYTICRMFDDGDSVETIANILISSGLEAEDAGMLVGITVPMLCPEHQPILDAFLGDI